MPSGTRLAADAREAWIPEHWVDIDVIPRDDKGAVERHILEQRPMVLQGRSIVPVSNWADIGTLKEKMSKTKVLVKHSGRERVAYFRSDRNTGQYDFDAEAFIRESKVPFSEFVALADKARSQAATCKATDASKAKGIGGGDTSTSAGATAGAAKSALSFAFEQGRCDAMQLLMGIGVQQCPKACIPSIDTREDEEIGATKEVLYCQEPFVGHPELEQEFSTWDWAWVLQQCRSHGWGLPETNVLFMGSEGATTPAHFDEQHNFLNQVRGSKLVVLFPPDDYTRLYPFPVTHPCDRCSMVDVQHADIKRFPRFEQARGHVVTLGPGDVLYIPYGWWHYCRTLTHLAASITFWSQARELGLDASTATLPPTMGAKEWVRARRNLEKLLAEDVGAPNLGKEVLRLLGLIEAGGVSNDPRLGALRKMLGMLEVPREEQLAFLNATFSGRFGFDSNPYV